MHKRTKIVCTLGPASEASDTIEAMVNAGMNVARLNFSHGTYDNHALLMKRVREVAKKRNEPVAILQDLQGPKIRVGILPDGGVELKKKQRVVFDTACTECKDGLIPVDYHELHQFVKPGERLFLNDGRVEGKIVSVSGTKIEVEITAGGIITSHKGLNVPDSDMPVRALTDKDKADAKFGVAQGVDFIALSFVKDASDIIDVRYLIKQYEEELKIIGEQPIRIIAKIERHQAVENIKEILDVVDGIMIARGDLGIEIPAADVPLVQKRLIDLAREAGKLVIVATQMLDSMQENPRPTRAEVSDVANAVIDHTDAVMLSNETATGKYPVETVATMTDIIHETEASHYDDLPLELPRDRSEPIDEAVSKISRLIADQVKAKVILSASISGETGRLLSSYRPELPIVVATSSERVRHQLNLSWGVVPFVLPPCKSIEELIERSFSYLTKQKIVKKGDQVVVVAGEPVGEAGHVNLLEVREVK